MYNIRAKIYCFFQKIATKVSPATGEGFAALRFPPQLLGNISYPYDFLPSCWGTFRAPRFPPQLLGNVSRAAISSPVAGERFARRDFFPSCWGAFRAPRFFPQLLGNLNTIFYIRQRNCAAVRDRRCISNRGRDPGRSLSDIGRRDSGRRRSPEGLRCCKSGSRRPL